jgi:hypothetical protein
VNCGACDDPRRTAEGRGAVSVDDDTIQVVFQDYLRAPLEKWVRQMGWELWRMPDFVEDDLPCYGNRPATPEQEDGS